MTQLSFLTWIEVSYLSAFLIPFFFRHPLGGFAFSLGISLVLLGTGFMASGTLVNPEHDKTFLTLLENILAWERMPFILSMAGTTVSWFLKRSFDIKVRKKRVSFHEDQTWTLWGVPFYPIDIVWSLIGMCVTGLLVASLGSLFYFGNVDYFNRLRQERIAKASNSIAKRLGFSLPQKIDDMSSLQKVSANGTALTFYYTLNRKIPATEAREFLEDRKQNLKLAHCTHPSMEKILRMGGAFRFYFTDVGGTEIGKFILSKEECAP